MSPRNTAHRHQGAEGTGKISDTKVPPEALEGCFSPVCPMDLAGVIGTGASAPLSDTNMKTQGKPAGRTVYVCYRQSLAACAHVPPPGIPADT